jgi:hypothetical protein
MMLGLGHNFCAAHRQSCTAVVPNTDRNDGWGPYLDVKRAHAVRPTPCQVGGRVEQTIHQHGAICLLGMVHRRSHTLS